MNIITGLLGAAKTIATKSVCEFTQAAGNVIKGDAPFKANTYQKREYFEEKTQAPVTTDVKSMDGLWSSLPKINPRVLVGGNGYTGMIDDELIRDTNANWDPRGELDAIKKIQSVTIPGFLVNDRNLTAAQQRSWNREMEGDRPLSI